MDRVIQRSVELEVVQAVGRMPALVAMWCHCRIFKKS